MGVLRLNLELSSVPGLVGTVFGGVLPQIENDLVASLWLSPSDLKSGPTNIFIQPCVFPTGRIMYTAMSENAVVARTYTATAPTQNFIQTSNGPRWFVVTAHACWLSLLLGSNVTVRDAIILSKDLVVSLQIRIANNTPAATNTDYSVVYNQPLVELVKSGSDVTPLLPAINIPREDCYYQEHTEELINSMLGTLSLI